MICEYCGKDHNGTYGSGRFCSEACAKGFSTKYIRHSYKNAKCIICGKSIMIHKYASSLIAKCDDCKKAHKIYTSCKICGSKYVKGEKCENKFCQEHNIRQFRSLIKYFGFDKSKLGTLEVENEFNRIRNILYDLYWKRHLSSSEICKIYDYPSAANLTAKVFTYLNIPSKTSKESIIENYLENRLSPNSNTQYKQDWHITWNNKKVYLRSSYELDYAKELDKQHINYEVEFFRIRYWDSQRKEYRCAIPDFYIPDENMIIEIKSVYTLDKQNMIDKQKAYLDNGYNFKLICDHKELIL